MSRSSGADRAAWREHEKRAGDLVDEKALLSPFYAGYHDMLTSWRQRLAEEPPERLGSALMLVARMFDRVHDHNSNNLREPVAQLLRKRFEVTDADALLAASTALHTRSFWGKFVAMRIAEVMLRDRFGPTVTDEAALDLTGQMIDVLAADPQAGAEAIAMRARLRKLLPVSALDTSLITPGDGWATDVVPRLSSGEVDAETAVELLVQLAAATGSKPGKAWAAATAQLLEKPATRAVLRLLLERLAEAEPVKVDHYLAGGVIDVLLDSPNSDLTRAAAWATVTLTEPWVVPALQAIVLRAYDWRAGWISSQKAPNAAIFALGQLGAVAALSTLDAKTTDNGYRKRIAAAVAAAGAAEGLSPGQILERMVDAGGLSAAGTVEFARDTVTGRAVLDDDLTVTLTWPASRVDADSTDVNAIKRQVRDLRALVAAERRRVEGLFAEDRAWDVSEWRKYYLEHPVTGRIAARLLWRFGEATGFGSDAPSAGPVRLWHPATATTDEIAAWRDYLVEHEVRQPFKQAYREIYPLTDAERETGTYSNRFAAHVLHYNQAYALFKQRGWVANYLGPYEGGYDGEARREFRDAGITAVFAHFPVDQNRRAAAELCSTDRVWFHRGGRAREPVPLTEVPPLVFTEAMRDVDLFVGVASIALDPNWADRGDDPHYGYWEQVSFGELSARAQVRRDVLARILPKLAIADRVELGDRYVRVRGKRATYKIHIGSANIMIEPADRYLCIVPKPNRGKVVLLPFEGDEVLAVIMSKIVMLAADDKIKDGTILSQLDR